MMEEEVVQYYWVIAVSPILAFRLAGTPPWAPMLFQEACSCASRAAAAVSAADLAAESPTLLPFK
jgi:hypothetical protein